ncbi:MAG: metallophosphoesterase [Candidatus Aenigmatarchaeota archaeon]
MRLLVIADIHGQYHILEKIINKVKNEDFDCIVCPGDFTDMFSVPEEFTQMDIVNIIIQKILTLKKPFFAVPGNHDPYESLNLFDDFGINCHGQIKKIDDVKITGWGGALTPFHTKFEPTEEETEDMLKALENLNKFIFLTHNPPYNTKMDLTNTGQHVGSKAIRQFIIERKPFLVISAHIHEAAGIDVLEKSIIFNPGPVYEGMYGIVDTEPEIKCYTKKI